MTFSGNKARCPNCGYLAESVSGVFNLSDNTIEIIRGSQATKDQLVRFADLLRAAYDKKLSIVDLQARAAEIDPRLGEASAKIAQSSVPASLMILLLLAFLSQCNFNLEASVDLNKLYDQFFGKPPEQTLEEADAASGKRQEAQIEHRSRDADAASGGADPKADRVGHSDPPAKTVPVPKPKPLSPPAPASRSNWATKKKGRKSRRP